MSLWLIKELLLLVSITSLPQITYFPEPPLSPRDGWQNIFGEKQIQSLLTDRNWIRFDVHRLIAAQDAVPDLGSAQRQWIQGWSCGPNSLVRAVALAMGKKSFRREKDYLQFALRLPKALGVYQDRSLDNAMSYNTFWFKGMERFLNILQIPDGLRWGMSFFHINTGSLPKWLVEYMNAYAFRDKKLEGLVFEFYGTDDFSKVQSCIEGHLAKGNAVIPLIAYHPLAWHYLNVVGYNPKRNQVMVLDGSLFDMWPISYLQGVMYMGYSSEGYLHNELPTVVAGAVANWFSEVNFYNLIIVRNTRSERSAEPFSCQL